MKCPNILKPSVAVAVTVCCFALFLAPCCLAAAIDAEGLPQEVLVPFNDLLPPLPDAEFEQAQTALTTTKPATTTTASPTTLSATTTITTITTTDAPTTITTTAIPPTTLAPPKPTKAATPQQLKKTQYQLERQQTQQQQQLVAPALDLNPEVPPPLPEAETPVAPVKVTEPKQAASTEHLQHIQAGQTQYQTLQKHLQPQKLQQQKQQFAKQLLQQPQIQRKLLPQAAATITKVAYTPQQAPQTQRQVNIEQLQQYLQYFYHPTTRRPSRGALPTLTPFPRHFK